MIHGFVLELLLDEDVELELVELLLVELLDELLLDELDVELLL